MLKLFLYNSNIQIDERYTVLIISSTGGSRTPKEAYSLSNCTWYKDNACCDRTEVTSVFKEMPALLTDNKGCYDRINYLMCYFCSPKQQLWFNKSLSVCRSYCDQIYSHCRSAKYNGFSIGSNYESGVAFCKAQMFNVIVKNGENCFEFDPTKFDAGTKTRMPSWLMLTIVTTGLTTRWLISSG